MSLPETGFPFFDVNIRVAVGHGFVIVCSPGVHLFGKYETKQPCFCYYHVEINLLESIEIKIAE
jgi:hypothetical protein